MSTTLLQKEVKIKRVTTIGHQAARALNDRARMKIMEILSHKQMSTDELVKELGNFGHKKATTTVRHHLDILKSAGLIETARMEEARGAVLKYYSPTVRVFDYDSPDIEGKNAKLVNDTGTKLLKVLTGILTDKKIWSTFETKKHSSHCNMCSKDHFKEYITLEVLNFALARAMEKQEFIELVQKHEPQKK